MSEKVDLTEVIDGLVDLIGKDRHALLDIKKVAVAHQSYKLACAIRDIEKEKYPESAADRKKVYDSEAFSTSLRIAGIKTSVKCSFVVLSIARAIIGDGKGDINIDIETVSEIQSEADRIFG